jgi:hypothetical protein
MNRRQFSQSLALTVAATALASPLAAKVPEPDTRLCKDDVNIAIIQSRAADISAMMIEVDQLFKVGAKDLICFPALQGEQQKNTLDLKGLAHKAVQYNVHIAAHMTVPDQIRPQSMPFLFTPAGDIHAGRGVHRTAIGNIALMSSADAADVVPADSEILVNMSAGPVSYEAMQSLARDRDMYVVAATAVGDSFIQASGSVIFGPRGEALAVAGLAWTQTVSATLPLGHYRARHPGIRQPQRVIAMS